MSAIAKIEMTVPQFLGGGKSTIPPPHVVVMGLGMHPGAECHRDGDQIDSTPHACFKT